ncbi:hypothetical protein LOTGIDRAFT_130108, partial [Lottia gigantea]
VLSLQHNPYLMKVENQYQGIAIDILDRLASKLNFTYTVTLQEDGKFGYEHTPGEWNGLIGSIRDGKADIAAAQLTVTSKRAKVIEFSHPFMNSGLKILYKPPNPWANGEPLTVLFTPFSPAVWFMILLVFFGISLFFYAVGRFSPYEDCSFVGKASTYEGLTLINSLLYTFSSLTWQGYTAAPRSISGRIMATFWWIFTILFIGTYVANLTAFFLTAEPLVRDVPFMTFQELAKQKKIPFGTFRHGSTRAYFENSKKMLQQRIFARMNASDDNYVDDIEEALRKVRTENYAFICEEPMADYYAAQLPCDLMVAGELDVNRDFSFACNISGLCTRFDHAILEMRENEEIYDIQQKWLNSGCLKDAMKEVLFEGLPMFDSFDKSTNIAYEKAVTLRRFSGALLIALIGFILGAIALAGEILYARKRGTPLVSKVTSIIIKHHFD